MIEPYSKEKQLGRQHISVNSIKADKGTEAELQDKIEAYLKEQNIQYLHISEHVYQNRKAAHQYCGWPDIMAFRPSIKELAIYDGVKAVIEQGPSINECLMMELKSRTGKTRTGQNRIARHLNVYLVRSFDYAKELIDEFMK